MQSLLTGLAMTTAEAVETSVTTINILSQDFTNLDDQPSQTLTNTLGFKPFTLLKKIFSLDEESSDAYDQSLTVKKNKTF